MWERSPTARLIWGIVWAVLLAGTGGAALSTGRLPFIAAFLLVVAVGAVQLWAAGPTTGRLWDSPLTKVLYAYIAIGGVYLFGKASFETGDPIAIAPLVVLLGFIALQWSVVLRDRTGS